jgi:5'-deoxynucleotidase YfbR-like HD superfamily hydrolase
VTAAADAAVADLRLGGLTPLLGELSDLKRVRVAGRDGSLAEQGFRRAWAALVAGEEPRDVALRETALALAATKLPGVDAAALRAAGLDADTAVAVQRRALAAACGDAVDAGLATDLAAVLGGPSPGSGSGGLPAFVGLLAAQPRAGATAPGQPRLVLEPPESHADHCFVVAVVAVLLAPQAGGDPGTCFLGALGHHLHNARLADTGFAGEVLLGEHLDAVVDHLTRAALDELPAGVRGRVEAALGLNLHLDTPEARAVVAADVLDRVLQMRHHARAAAFTLDVALDELDLVHAGPLQAYGLDVVAAAGLR